MLRPTADELRTRAVIVQGHTDDLLLEVAGYRWWLSRMTVEDGEPCDRKVTVEALQAGRWVTVDVYAGNDTRRTLRENGRWL